MPEIGGIAITRSSSSSRRGQRTRVIIRDLESMQQTPAEGRCCWREVERSGCLLIDVTARCTAGEKAAPREESVDARGEEFETGPEGRDRGGDDAQSDFPGAPLPVRDAAPGNVGVDVLAVQNGADGAADGGTEERDEQS